MAQSFDGTKPLEGTTNIQDGTFYTVVRDHFEALRSYFSGTSQISNPVEGQFGLDTDRGVNGLYELYHENTWENLGKFSIYNEQKPFADFDVGADNYLIDIDGLTRIILTNTTADYFVKLTGGATMQRVIVVVHPNSTFNVKFDHVDNLMELPNSVDWISGTDGGAIEFSVFGTENKAYHAINSIKY